MNNANKINYRAEVLKLHPTAKSYHTGSILGGALKIYHVGIPDGDVIKILVPGEKFCGNKPGAWKIAYEHLTPTTTHDEHTDK